MMKQFIAVCSPTNPLEKIRAALLRKKTDVHVTTVSRRLRFHCGLKSYKPACKLVREQIAIRFIIRSSRRMFDWPPVSIQDYVTPITIKICNCL